MSRVTKQVNWHGVGDIKFVELYATPNDLPKKVRYALCDNISALKSALMGFKKDVRVDIFPTMIRYEKRLLNINEIAIAVFQASALDVKTTFTKVMTTIAYMYGTNADFVYPLIIDACAYVHSTEVMQKAGIFNIAIHFSDLLEKQLEEYKLEYDHKINCDLMIMETDVVQKNALLKGYVSNEHPLNADGVPHLFQLYFNNSIFFDDAVKAGLDVNVVDADGKGIIDYLVERFYMCAFRQMESFEDFFLDVLCFVDWGLTGKRDELLAKIKSYDKFADVGSIDDYAYMFFNFGSADKSN